MVTWQELSAADQEMLTQAEIYAQVGVGATDFERLEVAGHLVHAGLLRVHDYVPFKGGTYEITGKGREVYKQGNTAAPPAPDGAAAEVAGDGDMPEDNPAYLDGYAAARKQYQAEIERLQAELAAARRDFQRLEGLAAEIVHAQMVLQTALGYDEVDYNVSLTDLAEDIEALRGALLPFVPLANAFLALRNGLPYYSGDDSKAISVHDVSVTFGDLQRVAQAADTRAPGAGATERGEGA